MAEIKDKKAMINDGKNIELDGVTVINEGIYLAEAKKEEPKEETPVVSEDVVVPNVSNEVSVSDVQASIPEVSPIDVPIAPVDLPIIPVGTPEMTVSPEPQQASLPSFESKEETAPVYNYEPTNLKTDFSTSGVYKSTNDVDLAAIAFLNESKEAYYKNIVEPTKAVVALVNDFVTWGNKVTTQGLNRTLFEEFDKLSDRYAGMEIAKYGDDNNYNNVNDINGFNSSYGNDSNNFGGMAA